MDADIQGCLNQIDVSWKAFVHNNKVMSKDQVKAVLEYGLKCGYKQVSQIKDEEINSVLALLVEPKYCASCGDPFEIRPKMFFWKGKYFTGLVCAKCNSLWDNPHDSFAKHLNLNQHEI